MKICVLIPTYNNAGTIRRVVEEALREIPDVLVACDGCTDDTLERLRDLPVTILSWPRNAGKGVALRRGLSKAREMGFTYAITLDADGQHFPGDIPRFLAAIEAHPGALVTGVRNLRSDGMPAGNTFANHFSNFWFTVQTARRLPDTQGGFRAYPLHRLPWLGLLTARYESELELLVFSAWRGVPIVPVPIRVYYPPESERVSHFRPIWDFARIFVLNTCLCILALVYGYPRMALRALCRKHSPRSVSL